MDDNPSLIRGEFLALTGSETGKPVFIDPACVDAVVAGGEYTLVVFGGEQAGVREPIEAVVDAINEYASYSARW